MDVNGVIPYQIRTTSQLPSIQFSIINVSINSRIVSVSAVWLATFLSSFFCYFCLVYFLWVGERLLLISLPLCMYAILDVFSFYLFFLFLSSHACFGVRAVVSLIPNVRFFSGLFAMEFFI